LIWIILKNCYIFSGFINLLQKLGSGFLDIKGNNSAVSV
jgi:hypothetical protein